MKTLAGARGGPGTQVLPVKPKLSKHHIGWCFSSPGRKPRSTCARESPAHVNHLEGITEEKGRGGRVGDADALAHPLPAGDSRLPTLALLLGRQRRDVASTAVGRLLAFGAGSCRRRSSEPALSFQHKCPFVKQQGWRLQDLQASVLQEVREAQNFQRVHLRASHGSASPPSSLSARSVSRYREGVSYLPRPHQAFPLVSLAEASLFFSPFSYLDADFKASRPCTHIFYNVPSLPLFYNVSLKCLKWYQANPWRNTVHLSSWWKVTGCCCSVAQWVWFCVTPWAVARQAPVVHGILQARIREWGFFVLLQGIFQT